MYNEVTAKEIGKISDSKHSLALFGVMIVAFSLGAIYSIKLVLYGYFILIISSLTIASFIKFNYMSWHKNIRLSFTTQVTGLIGSIFLLLFLGIQSPHVPFTKYLAILGIILIVPALIDLLRGIKP